MRQILTKYIDEFYDSEIPTVKNRDISIPGLPSKPDVLIGMRRTGKTFFCYQIIKGLLKSGINKNRIFMINFEDDRLLEFTVKDFSILVEEYYKKFPDNKSKECYFFFDEIHNVPDWEMFIRRLTDSEKIKVYITGSSAKLLSKEIATSLRGRSIATEVFPLSFIEYLKFNNINIDLNGMFSSRKTAVLRNAFDSFMQTGGFPEIQGLDRSDRILILQNYINTVIQRDIADRHQIRETRILKLLVNKLMNEFSRQFSVNKFYNYLKSLNFSCSKNTLYDYIGYLEDSYLIFNVSEYSKSFNKKNTSPKKVYIADTGLINSEIFLSDYDRGHLLENIVYMHLRRNSLNEIFYYKTSGKNDLKSKEIDFFVIDKLHCKKHLLQVSWEIDNKKTFDREVSALEAAMKEQKVDDATIITYNTENNINGINVVPIWKWLLN